MLNWLSGERAPHKKYPKRPLCLAGIYQPPQEWPLQASGDALWGETGPVAAGREHDCFTRAAELVAETNHRIANSLTLLAGMVRMQMASAAKKPGPYSNAEVRQMLDGVAARITTIGQLHRSLSHSSDDGAINLKPHLRDVTNSLVTALSSPEQQVRIVQTGCDCTVLMRQVQPIVLIVCEIFINAMKYAHPAGGPLVMAVDCNGNGDGGLVLTVSDNGVGLPEGFEAGKSHGMGFKVMHSLAAQIGGNLQVQSSSLGLSFHLSLAAGALAGAKPA